MSNELPQGPTEPDEPSKDPEDAEFLGFPIYFSGRETPGAAGHRLDKEELTILFRHYLKVAQSIDSGVHLAYGVSGSERMGQLYAYDRLKHLRAALGDAAADAIEAKLDQEDRASMGTANWRARYSLDAGKRTLDEWARLDQKADDTVARARAIAYLADHPSEVFVDRDGDWWYLELFPGRDGGDPVLWLRIRSRTGTEVGADFHMPEPDGWFPPYGLK